MAERVLVTGPDGFVGRRVCERLRRDGFTVRGAQLAAAPLPDGCEHIIVGDLAAAVNWDEAMRAVDYVVHLAARVHIMNDESVDPLSEYRHVNVAGTRAAAAAAAAAGVKRFVFVSTVKVLGESTADSPFTAESVPAPLDPYGISKLEAEKLLFELSTRTGMQVTVVRPPLVYGPGVRANFLKLIALAEKRLPLPLGLVRNRRSLVGVHNLVDFLACCLTHANAANQTFLVSDGDDLSTAELVRTIAGAFGHRAVLPPVPPAALQFAGMLFGRGAEIARLCDSLALDISKARERLGWTPPVSVEEGIRETVEWFLSENG